MLRRTKLVLDDASVNQLFANSFDCATLRISLLFVPLCGEILRKSMILLKEAEGEDTALLLELVHTPRR